MAFGNAFLNIRKLKNLADWKLLLFLVLFLNVKMAVKIPAILLIYLLQFDFKFGFRFKNSRLPLFYLLAITIALLNWIISRSCFNINYDIVLLTGIGFWLLCILAIHQVKLFVEKNDTEIVHRTIVLFFVINAILSFSNIVAIIWETGAFNPYTYQGQFQKYFIGTGDYIKGITFDTSTTNAMLNALGVIYFLNKKNAVMLLLCMATMLLTASNFTNILVLICFAILFLFKSTRDQKSLIAVCTMFLVIFMVKVSPQNFTYVHEVVKNIIHPQVKRIIPPQAAVIPLEVKPSLQKTVTANQPTRVFAQNYIDSVYAINHPKQALAAKINRARKPVAPITLTSEGRIIIPEPDINSRPYQHIADTNDYQKKLLGFIDTHKESLPISSQSDYRSKLPGKAISLLQTLHFLAQHPLKFIWGDGIGNFSSKLAFRTSGLGFAGGYPQKYIYLDPDFLSNHLDLYLNFFSKKTDYHSLTNSPDSVYDQLLAEYGVLGVIAFLICYVGYFLKHYKILTYGLPILFIVIALFSIEYWFEQLSIVVFFELLLLLNIKENSPKPVLVNA